MLSGFLFKKVSKKKNSTCLVSLPSYKNFCFYFRRLLLLVVKLHLQKVLDVDLSDVVNDIFVVK